MLWTSICTTLLGELRKKVFRWNAGNLSLCGVIAELFVHYSTLEYYRKLWVAGIPIKTKEKD